MGDRAKGGPSSKQRAGNLGQVLRLMFPEGDACGGEAPGWRRQTSWRWGQCTRGVGLPEEGHSSRLARYEYSAEQARP